MEKGQSVIYFDGVCNLCNAWVRFVHKYDKKNTFSFDSLQNPKVIDFLTEKGLNTEDTDSIVLLQNDTLLLRSDAALEILSQLGFPFRLLSLGKIFPKRLRDTIYSYIAKNRYRWFGKTETCVYDPNFETQRHATNKS